MAEPTKKEDAQKPSVSGGARNSPNFGGAGTESSVPAGSSNYGKRPLWQWVLIYLIIAAVVYGLVYYFFLSGLY